jgi:D-lactate dehydrogenase
MATIHFYDIEEEEKQLLEQSLSNHSCVFHTSCILLENVDENAEAISVFVSSTVTEAMIDKMPHLKLIACRSAGYNNIAMHKAEERGIKVVVVPSYGEHTVAEYTFALLLSLSRKIPQTIRSLKDGVCLEPKLVRGSDIFVKKMGVIGTGKIGRRVIAMARGFGMNVIAYDTYEDPSQAHQLGFMYVTLEDLLKQSDIISLHAPLTEENKHILNEHAFSLMKDGVYIINTARGELIDTKALMAALHTSKVAGVGLDVIEGEELLREKCSPLPGYSRESTKMLEESFYISNLLKDERVILTPHIAYNTKEAVERIIATTAENIKNFFNGQTTNEVRAGKKVMGKLVLVRHTQSEWNETGTWTGTRDAKLTLKGFEDARLLGNIIHDIVIDNAFASLQIRTMETLSSLLGSLQQPTVSITRDKALNERDYGDYTGKNKNDMKELLGQDLFDKIRRGWNVDIPNGETLSMVYERVIPYYQSTILPLLSQGKNVLVLSHGNTLRALMKYIEAISDEAIEHVEMPFNTAIVYTLNDQGHIKDKDVRKIQSDPIEI